MLEQYAARLLLQLLGCHPFSALECCKIRMFTFEDARICEYPVELQ